MRAVTPSGSTRNVAGSGIATMSDSSIALKPVIDEPSKPMPSSSAPSTSPVVIEKLLRCPSRSVNQRSTSSIPSSFICFSALFRAPGSDVARFLLSTCAIASSYSPVPCPTLDPLSVLGLPGYPRRDGREFPRRARDDGVEAPSSCRSHLALAHRSRRLVLAAPERPPFRGRLGGAGKRVHPRGRRDQEQLPHGQRAGIHRLRPG